jgi:hypothetical protein
LAGEQDLAQLFKEGLTTSVGTSKMRHAWKFRQENVGLTLFTSDKALCFFLNTELGQHQGQLTMFNAK